MVGYTTTTLASGGWALAAAQFQSTAGDTLDANDLVKASVAKYSYNGDDYIAGWETTAPTIQIRVGNSYEIYYYCADADDGNGNYVEGWANDIGILVTKPLAAGKGFWLNNATDDSVTFTLAGQVVGTSTANATGTAGFNLVANPYPQGFDINAEGITWNLTPQNSYDGDDYITGWETSASAIQIRVGGSYEIYYYCGDADDGAGNYVEGWANDIGILVNKTIAPACGFWIESKDANFSAVFTK